jgi:hypothetical protein
MFVGAAAGILERAKMLEGAPCETEFDRTAAP